MFYLLTSTRKNLRIHDNNNELHRFFQEILSATVHLDGTARPQIVRKNINSRFFDILAEYQKITGIPAMINTSFNMHEEPIVEAPTDAIRAYLDMKADYLVIGNYLIHI